MDAPLMRQGLAIRTALHLILVIVCCACGRRDPLPTAPMLADQLASANAAGKRRAVAPPSELPPPCDAPAPIAHVSEPVGVYIFVYRDGIDSLTMTAQLAQLYSFEPRHVFSGPPWQGFSAIVSQQILAQLRCEQAIARVEEAAAPRFP